jgi:spore germination protein
MSNFSYHIQPDGSLVPLDDTALIRAEMDERVAPLMTITNFSGRRFSPELAHSVLISTDVQDVLIDNIITTMRNKGYFGLNIDFEYVPREDRERYNSFLQRTVERLHPLGYSVSTAIAPKISAQQQGLLYEAHDYPAHSRIVDFIVLMTYEWGWAGGPPLAIAPINEVRRVLDYAVTVIPRTKILMGAPTYGRDWKLPFIQGTTIAETISPQEAILRAVRYGVSIQYNELYQSPFFRYTDEEGARHEVWFEDARSIQSKYRTVKEYGLRGVSYWELTSSFPQNWYVLENNFRIRKLV